MVAFRSVTCYIGAVIAPDEFRHVLSHFATGVTVVTTLDAEERPVGLTASSFTSVSLDPPLILVCVDDKAQCYGAFCDAGRFAVNILHTDQEHLSRRFATTRIENKFEGVEYTVTAHRVPLLEKAHAHLECTTVGMHHAGDHTIFVGRVESARAGDGHPLLYYRGRYGRLHRAEM
jgi:flavin reductase (DIM6/NTAB) family NADH-FMN oxidoreductase RutF